MLLWPPNLGDARTMNSHFRSLTFLFGMAPLGLGCSGSKGDDGDDSTDDTGETGTTSASGDGTATAGTSSTTDAGSSTTTDDGSTDDGDPTGGTGDLCEDYAAAYVNCYGSNYGNYSLEWCLNAQAYIQEYYSAECLAAWEAAIACHTAADCFYSYTQCEAEYLAQQQACVYEGVYNGCDMIGQMVGGCISPAAGEDAKIECDQTYANLYAMHGGWCGDAFMQMMVCISSLDCLALSDKQYVFDNCGPEIQAKNQACQ
jgi:hypothetical protein